MKNSIEKKDKVPFSKMLIWQTSPISAGAVVIILGYLMLYCTNILGMDAALVGSLLMASKIFDGITDLIAGWLVENTHTRWGKGRPYGLCIIGVWICAYALFAVPENWGITGKAVWIFIMYTLLMSVFQTLISASETTYVIRAFGTSDAITKVSSYGGIIITLVSMVVSITFPMFVANMTDAQGWKKLVLMYGIPLLILGLMRFVFIKEDKVKEENGQEKAEKVSLKEILHVLRTNKYIWLLAIAIMIPNLIGSMSAGTYYFTVIVGDLGAYSIIQVFSVVILLFMFVFPMLLRRFSGMQVVGMAGALGVAGYMINFFAGSNIPALVIASIFTGISVLPASYLRSVLILRVSEYNRIKGMNSREATFAALINFMTKIGNAFGSFLIGILLSIFAYDGTAAVQTDSAQMMIRMCYSVIPAALMVIVIFCSMAFNPMEKEIKQKKEQG